MMSARRLSMPRRVAPTLIATAIMLLPALATLAPEASAENVTFADGTVPWVNVPGIATRLYFKCSAATGCSSGIPNPLGGVLPGGGGNLGGGTLSMDTFRPKSSANPLVPEGAYSTIAVGTPPAGIPASAHIKSSPLLHEVNITGDNSLTVDWFGRFASGLRWTVTVSAEQPAGTTVGKLSWTDSDTDPRDALCTVGPSNDGHCTAAIPLDKSYRGRFTFKLNSLIVVDIQADPGVGGAPVPGVDTWQLRTDDPTDASGLDFRSENGIKVATWTTDKDSVVSKVFRPLYRPEAYNRVDAFFALQDAFGNKEVCQPDNNNVCQGPNAETHVLWKGNRTQFPIGPSNNTTIVMHRDDNTSDEQGITVWRFPRELWDVGKFPFPTGEFTLQTTLRFRNFDEQVQSVVLNAEWNFVISTQNIGLRPYDDDDAATQPSPLESQSHDMAPGGSTTFLILARNGGTVADNFTLEVKQAAGTPAFGWQATIGGDEVTGGNRVPVGAGEERLFTLTVNAPPGTRVGDSVIFSVIAHSTVDASVKSLPYSVIATVSNVIRQDVGVITIHDTERVRPGQDNPVRAFVWNRGTRPDNVTFTLRERTTSGWNLSVQDGTSRYQRTLSAVPAGALAAVTVLVAPEAQLSVGTDHNATFNATRAAGLAGGSERGVSFTLTTLSSFKIEILKGINADRHYVEMACAGGTGPAPLPNVGYCPADGSDPQDAVAGTYFRVWLTNTGDVAARYEMSADHPVESSNPLDSSRANGFTQRIQVGYRDLKGKFNEQKNIELAPRETGELYVWVPHLSDTSSIKEDTFAFQIVVNNTGTHQQLRRTVDVTAWDAENEQGSLGPGAVQGASDIVAVKLEGAERGADYFTGSFRPIVKTQEASAPIIKRFVDLSGTATFFHVRLTNGAAANDRNISLELLGGDSARRDGWNVTMRPRNGELDQKKNPWKTKLNVDSFSIPNQRFESFGDTEIEVQVRPPINGTSRLAAGETREFILRAAQGGVNGASATIDLQATVTQLANVTLRAPDGLTSLVHAGQQTAFALLLANNGSIDAPVTISARVTNDTPNAALWTLSPKDQSIGMVAHENRTLALIIGAPATAQAGDKAIVNVSAQFRRIPNDPTSPLLTKFLELTIEVRQPSKLRLTSIPSAREASANDVATFQLELKNLDTTRRVGYTIRASPLPNWTQSIRTILSPQGTSEGVVEAGATVSIPYILNVPSDVLKDRSYASVVTVTDKDPATNGDNFDMAVTTVNIIGGQPFPIVSSVKTTDLVNRGGAVRFAMGVKNLGSATGSFPLEAKVGPDPTWSARVEDAAGRTITTLTVKPNEFVPVFLVVRAPLNAVEGARESATLTAFDPTFGRNSAATATALIHDYGVDLEVRPPRADVSPGGSVDFSVHVTNLGNGNDTLNLTSDLQGLTDWTTEFSIDQVTLEPGASADVHLTVRSPKDKLAVSRQYTMSILGGSVGGAGLGITKNDSAPIVLNVLNYRPFDVDSDGFLEIAVDQNKRTADGFEVFREITSQGAATQVVDNLSGKQDGKIDFLLEIPRDGSYTGIANVYFDPNEPFVYSIEFTPDINGDATPDYLIDTDNDGVIDHAWDTATRTLWDVTVIRAFGGSAEQYLIDLNHDGKPDRYYDPAQNLVTKTIPQTDGRIGIVTNRNSLNPTKFYDTKSGVVSDARVANVGDFAKTYWYFFVAALVVLVVSGVVISRRRKGPES